MESEIFLVVASDQYAEEKKKKKKKLSPNSLHLSSSPSMISKRGLLVSSMVIYLKKNIKIIHTTIS